MNIFGFKKKSNFSAKEILNQLDKCAEEFTFPMLDNGYVYPITSRMSLYRDDSRWMIIIEVVGFNYRGGGHDGISNCLHIFGNCINTPPGTDNNNFLYITSDTDQPSFDEEYQESLNPNAETILIRNKEVTINHNQSFYHDKGIELEEENKIFIWEFLRGLLPEYNDELLASESELKNRVPNDLPLFMELSEWYHPDCADSELPSQNDTFKLLANALEKGDKDIYKPKNKPNNHWKNWPDGGTL